MMRILIAISLVLLGTAVHAQTAVDVQGPPGPAGPAGAVGGKWAQGALAANQSAGLNVNDPIQYATWEGTLTTDPVNYRVTLEDGKRYLITVSVGAAFSSGTGEAAFRLYDVTNATAVGPFCGRRAQGSGGSSSDPPGSLTYIDTTSGERVLELRIVDSVNLLTVLSAYTWITVVEIGSSP